MLDRQAVKEFLGERLKGVEVSKDISFEELVEAFCQYVEDDYDEWLKDNFKSFFEFRDGRLDWSWIREKINKCKVEKLKLWRKMSKYDALKIWKKTLARTPKNCDKCGTAINPNETYFRETLKDSRINFIGRKFCVDCRSLEIRQTLPRS